MNNESSVAKIYWTEDYSLFNYLHGNRDISETKINKLIKDVQNGLNLFQYCPILVNSEYRIIDGQHRFFACRKLKHKIYYTIVPNFSLAQIAKLNNNQNRWKISDFLNCYIDAGKNSHHYVALKTFIEKYKITVSLGANLLMVGSASSGGRNLEMFREGDFEVKHLDEATKLMKKASEYSDYTDIYHSREFLCALQRLLSSNKFSHKKMLVKLQKNNLRIEKRANQKEYLTHLEELFNFKNSVRKTIY